MSTRPLPQPILATTCLTADLDTIVASAGISNPWKVVAMRNLGVEEVSTNAGVYCFVLPESALPKERRLILHGRTFGSKGARRQLQVQFDYQPKKFAVGDDLVVYVGKAANIRARVKGHLSTDTKATTNQVLRGLVGGPLTHMTQEALECARQTLREHGSVHFVEHCHQNESKADY